MFGYRFHAWVLPLLLAIPLSSLAQTAAKQAAPKPGTKPAQTLPAKTAPSKVQTINKGAFSFLIGPAPEWVTAVAVPTPSGLAAAPMHYRVIDEQIRVEGSSMSAYTRVVRVVNESAGLPVASQIELEFDPTYQTLTLHRLEVVRGGSRVNRLDAQRMQLLQRETGLEQRMYDGRVTLSVVLEDVRVGDEIDLSYTVRGLNPVFEGKFVHLAWMASHRGPVALYQVRLLAPTDRSIQHLADTTDVSVESKVSDGLRETVFRRNSVAQLRQEQGASAAAHLPEIVQFSEFADWAQVAAWGDRLFRRDAAGPRVEQKAAEIRATHLERAAQVQEALRFVQQDVRYFGTEIGINTHQPAAPDKVMEQRFGDCKDKVSLLAALLARLDVAAHPVLVSTRYRAHLEHLLPSPLAFDHVIARLDLDGASLWLDATRSHQSGGLTQRQSLGLGRGLELAPDSRALSALPAAYDTERMRVDDVIRVSSFTADPVLESRITYRGDLAEIYRDVIATQGLPAMAASLAQPYVRVYPRLRSLAPVRVDSSADDNAFSFVQQFALPEFWRFPEQRSLVADIVAWGLVEVLMAPKSETRRSALSAAFPGIYRHSVRIEFAEDVFSQPSSRQDDGGDAHVTLKNSVEATRNHVEFLAEARIVADEIAPAQWPAYSATLGKLLPRLGSIVAVPAVPPSQFESLGAELKALEEDLRRRRVKALTGAQTQAHFKAAILNAQLAAGRLPPPLKAQALVARGIAMDNLGYHEDGRRDFEAALVLAPESIDALNGAATNAQTLHQTARALELSNQVLKLRPRDTQALNTRALAEYFSEDLPGATRDWEAMLTDRATVRRGYPLIWISLVTRRNAQDVSRLVEKYPRDQWPSDWPRPLLEALLGTSSIDAALDAARKSKTPLEALCEAHFYVGEKYFSEGDLSRAREHWRKAVDQGVVEFVEYGAAQFRLAAK